MRFARLTLRATGIVRTGCCMREGQNPGKSEELSGSVGQVRVVLPVFAPSNEGYFEQVHPIMDLCLQSLSATTGPEVRVTVVANGCCAVVERDLASRVETGSIDELVVHRNNLGKVDAVMSGARSTFEEIVVISDCDVLFRPGWVDAALNMFRLFPECGFLGLTPLPNLRSYGTSTTVIGATLRRELTTAAVINNEDFRRFAESIGRPTIAGESAGEQLVVRRDGQMACVGAGHFCFVTRRAAMNKMPTSPCHGVPNGESDWLDLPLDRNGYWRLATTKAYAMHMGNRLEDWMGAELAAANGESSEEAISQSLPPVKPSALRVMPYRLRTSVARRIQPGPGASTIANV